MQRNHKSLIVLSGGQDSTTCAFIERLAQGPEAELHTLTFDYNQRHNRELIAAARISTIIGAKTHEKVVLGPILASSSPLVNHRSKVGTYETIADLPGGVEPTFVPGRNILFMTIAANRAYALGVRRIVLGLCQEDFGGYFDCRQVFVDLMALALGEGIAGDRSYFEIITPLMNLTKAESVERALKIPGCYEALAYSHTCYNGEFPPCGKCHACHLRNNGFVVAGVEDPLLLRAAADPTDTFTRTQ